MDPPHKYTNRVAQVNKFNISIVLFTNILLLGVILWYQ